MRTMAHSVTILIPSTSSNERRCQLTTPHPTDWINVGCTINLIFIHLFIMCNTISTAATSMNTYPWKIQIRFKTKWNFNTNQTEWDISCTISFMAMVSYFIPQVLLYYNIPPCGGIYKLYPTPRYRVLMIIRAALDWDLRKVALATRCEFT